MIKAVLLDLDHTLINTDVSFVPEYMRMVDTYFDELWHYPKLSRILAKVIGGATGPRGVEQTNSGVAVRLIAEATGKTIDEIVDAFSDFYADLYPTLQNCIEHIEPAAALIEFFRSQSLAVVIATNPLYPAEAIRLRLQWGGLPDKLDTYALVTTGDNMHFAKPDPSYYAEIVARVGVEPDETLMVGDSLENDILPAAEVGLNTFYIYHEGNDFPPQADGIGTLHDLYTRLTRENWLESVKPRPLKPEAIEPELRGNIGALFGMLSDVKPHQWDQHPDPDEWSIRQAVCHLLESEQAVQRPRLKRILAEDNPFLVVPHPPPGPQDAVSCDDDGLHAAQRFAHERIETIEWLRTLRPDDWQRPARHSIFGLTTLLEMAHFTAQHDRLHLNQICQTLGKCE
jgi:HAD superfamily hydrolase (TIGR01549 family)